MRPGHIVSKSTRTLTMEPTNDALVAQITHTIDYEPGCLNDLRIVRSSVLKSARNFIVYDKKEGVARFALTSQIKSIDDSADPCQAMNCNKNSVCILESERSAKCECKPGFASFGSKGCADVNECSSRSKNNCSANAECLNTEGSFRCQCLSGYKVSISLVYSSIHLILKFYIRETE